MPTLFLLAIVVIAFQHIVDKILLTYYFEAKPIHDTLLSQKIIKSLKYAVLPFLAFGCDTIFAHNCNHIFYYSGAFCTQNYEIIEKYAFPISFFFLLIAMPIYDYLSY